MPDPVDLYALPPEDFTAARDAAVKQARADGDRPRARELAGLRRPTASAHLVNLLVRREPDLVAQLLDLGGQLAQAQQAGSGEELRSLGEQRRALVAAVTGRAVDLAAREVTAAVRGEVEATLEAALADPGAAEAVRSGRLVRALSYAGFGGADLEGAVAPVPTGPEAAGDTPAPADRGAVRRAEAAAQEAAGLLDDAVRACERAQQREDDAVDALAAARDAETEAEQALADARAARADAEQASQRAAVQAEEAAERVRAAQERAEAARAELDRLRRGA